ncbi:MULTISPECIES: hypothetical protein [Proteus]|uniref:hypothetical protein n=4 Tax=Morganellaceae TaxID=1903414 RepID=UPI000D6E2A43|nr:MULTISPECIES: hypothetical protein [Proteus]MBG2836124.1 hypothetical protein [Proteus terrae subsp. cibarius]MBG2867232.1 hypothetical protein [Proteus terrae subsp. cibarius]MBJ2107953.1 hypothetical protein [Proteus terrae]MBJ2131825.1 hypothetical protein [Proteus terrae]MCT8230117.1 hypothetical protein [Proteus terrae]
MNMKINKNDISTSQILRISQGKKIKDVMSLWDKIKDWFQSNKREKALKIVENIVSKEQSNDKNYFKMAYDFLMLKAMSSDAYKEKIGIRIDNGLDNKKNITILIDDYNIFIKDVDDKQISKILKIINIFNRHSSIFSNEVALKCLYEKLEQNERESKNDELIFAELYLELDKKISSGEIDLELNKINFNQVDFYAISRLINVNETIDKNDPNLDIKKALRNDINRDTYIVNGEKIKSKNQDEAMQQFESLIQNLSEKNKKAIYYLLNQEGITLIKSYNTDLDYYTLTTSFSGDDIIKQEKVYSIKSLSDNRIELKIKYLKKSSDKENNNIILAKPFESKLYNFMYDMVAINNNLEPNNDKGLDNKIQEIKNQLNEKEPNLGKKFLDLLYRNKIINEDSIDISLQLNNGELFSLDGECTYRFY